MRKCTLETTSFPYAGEYKYDGVFPHQFSNFSVFLGGACGVNNWRRDVAMPFLLKEDITFFNSHVDEWYPELIEIEKEAKSSSLVNLFLLDTTKSRCIASFVEAAYLCAKDKNVVLVMLNDANGHPVPLVDGKKISKNEFECICQGRKVLTELAFSRDIPVFSSLLDGLEYTKSIVHKLRMSLKQLDADLPHYKQDWESPISCTENRSASVDSARSSILQTDSDIHHRFRLSSRQPTSQEQTAEKDAMERQHEMMKTQNPTTGSAACPFDKDVYMVCSRTIYALDSAAGKVLFGEQLAVSLLRQAGVHVVFASPGEEAVIQQRSLVPVERHDRVFFYLIRDSALELDTMVEAAFMIGRGLPVVICLQTTIPGYQSMVTLPQSIDNPFSQSQCDSAFTHKSCPDVASVESAGGVGRSMSTLPVSISSTCCGSIYPDSPGEMFHPATISNSLASRDSGLGTPLDSPGVDVSSVGAHPVILSLDEAGLKDYNRGRVYLASVADEMGTPVISAVDKAVERCLSLIFQV